jgi:hypothetical protein
MNAEISSALNIASSLSVELRGNYLRHQLFFGKVVDKVLQKLGIVSQSVVIVKPIHTDLG